MTNTRRWWIVALLFIASLINYLDRATISMALPMISHELHLGPEAKGVLLSAFFWSYAAMQIPIGWCADRCNLKRLYMGAFALWSVAQGLAGLANSLAALLVFRILLGAGESIYLPGGTTIVSRLFKPAERGFPSGVFDFGTRTGLVLEGLLVPWLLVHYGWRVTFVVLGFSALLWLVPWHCVFPPSAAQPSLVGPAGFDAARAPSELEARRFSGALLNRDLAGICLGFFCFDYYWYLLVTWLPDYLQTVRHLTVLEAGLYTALPFLVFGVSEPVGGLVADRLIGRGWDETRTRKGIVTVAFLTGLLLVPAVHVSSSASAIALIYGASLVGLSTGNLLVILQCCAPATDVGLWTGFENFAGNIGGIVAPLLTGFLIARTGSYSAGFMLAPALLLLGLIAYWWVVGPLKPLGAPAGAASELRPASMPPGTGR